MPIILASIAQATPESKSFTPPAALPKSPEPDERMTFVMPAEELIDADPGDMDDMDDTADFEDFVGKHFSEQKPDIEEKQSTISEREVYKG